MKALISSAKRDFRSYEADDIHNASDIIRYKEI